MSKTLTDLETNTRTYLDEASQADWLNTEVDYAINYAYHDVIASVIEVYELFYSTVNPFTYAIVLNQQEYAIDTSLIKVERVEINYQPNTANSVPSRCVAVAMDEIRGNLANTNTQGSYYSPGYYLHGQVGSQTIGFIPVPTLDSDTKGTKSISVWGVSLPGDLTSGSPTVNIPYPDRFSYLISLRAAAQLLRKGQQEENAAARYEQMFSVGKQEMQTFLKERQADGPNMISDWLVEDIDFSVLEIL